jgi:hypothetical protein
MVTYHLTAIRIEAFKMARTGDFKNCDAIEAALEQTGHARATAALRNPITRAHLDELCIRSSQGSNKRVLPSPSPQPDGGSELTHVESDPS